MSFFVENWYLFVLAAVSGGLLLWQTINGAKGGGVSVADAVNLINREKAVVIDVCEPAEFAAGHVTNARNVPLANIAAGVKGLPSNKALPLVVVCARGNRARLAASRLRELGFEQAHVLAGGLAAWREANMPIEKSA